MTDTNAQHPAEDGEVETFVVGQNTQKTGPTGQKTLTRDRISTEALVNVLVQQGICTEDELIAEEGRLQTERRAKAGAVFTPVQIVRSGRRHSHSHNPVKKWASKRRWARRLGTLLLGWKWRKVKKET